jgi:hypothetical protein
MHWIMLRNTVLHTFGISVFVFNPNINILILSSNILLNLPFNITMSLALPPHNSIFILNDFIAVILNKEKAQFALRAKITALHSKLLFAGKGG